MAFGKSFSCGFCVCGGRGGGGGVFLLLYCTLLAPISSSDSSHEIEASLTAMRFKAGTSGSVIQHQQYLVSHNRVRALVGLSPLSWSEKLARFAKLWGNQRRRDCALIHSNSDYSENICRGSEKRWKPADAVSAWAAEKKYYDRQRSQCMKRDCLHYTQLVWKQSLRVGCAKVICGPGDTFITCIYDPHGNVIGQRPF